MLQLKNVYGGYDKEPIIKGVEAEIHRREIFGIIGPNGSGKSTLLKMIHGGLPLMDGEVFLHGRALDTYKDKERARYMAVLPQQTEHTFPYTVREVVELGRYPYQSGWFASFRTEDEDIVREAMKETDVLSFADQSMNTLSGGEKQRVLLARALAQQPEVLLLDEPTNHLDISFQMNLLDTLSMWTKDKDLTVVTVLHDLNMASMYCDRLMLLKEGEVNALGRPDHVMSAERIEEIYQTSVCRKEHPSVPRPLITLTPQAAGEWTTSERPRSSIDKFSISYEPDYTHIKAPYHFKTLSSAVIGSGYGWEKEFVNRHVSKDYESDDPEQEYRQFLQEHHMDHADTIGMMTAAKLEHGTVMRDQTDEVDLLVMVTAGVSNAVDASKAYQHENISAEVGTINIWVWIDGILTDAAYVQSLMTVTEAKTKALLDAGIKDTTTETVATGTSTDSIVIAASQTGPSYPYAGTATALGKRIGYAVHHAVYDSLLQGAKTKVKRS